MKVLLINPPCQYMLRGDVPAVVMDETGAYPPLGLLYVAAHAETVADVEVSVMDCGPQGVTHADLGEEIRRRCPDVVGIQVMTFTLIDAMKVAQAVKAVCPETPVVFGGPHATIFPHETLALPAVDYVVCGEGEYHFANLLMAIRDGKVPPSISGLVCNGVQEAGVSLEYIEDLDQLPRPARHLLPLDIYTSPMAKRNPVTTMMSSRGCSGKCTFCDRPQMGKRFRKRSAKSVVDEMEHCVRDLGISEIIFYDDTFTLDRKRVLEICDLIDARKLKVHWDIRARVDTVTPEMLARLRRAGCYRIHYGVESGSPIIQKTIKKYLKLDRVREVFKQSRKLGIETLGYFMIGLPGEDEQELQKTLDMMCSIPMDYAHIAVLTPYPGTPIYYDGLACGLYDQDFWREYAANPTADFVPRSWTEYFTEEQLQAKLVEAYKRFYFRPSYILRRLTKVRSLGELFGKGRLGLKMFSSMVLGADKKKTRQADKTDRQGSMPA